MGLKSADASFALRRHLPPSFGSRQDTKTRWRGTRKVAIRMGKLSVERKHDEVFKPQRTQRTHSFPRVMNSSHIVVGNDFHPLGEGLCMSKGTLDLNIFS